MAGFLASCSTAVTLAWIHDRRARWWERFFKARSTKRTGKPCDSPMLDTNGAVGQVAYWVRDWSEGVSELRERV